MNNLDLMKQIFDEMPRYLDHLGKQVAKSDDLIDHHIRLCDEQLSNLQDLIKVRMDCEVRFVGKDNIYGDFRDHDKYIIEKIDEIKSSLCQLCYSNKYVYFYACSPEISSEKTRSDELIGLEKPTPKIRSDELIGLEKPTPKRGRFFETY